MTKSAKPKPEEIVQPKKKSRFARKPGMLGGKFRSPEALAGAVDSLSKSNEDQAQLNRAAILRAAADAVDADNRGELKSAKGLSIEQIRDLL